MFPQRQDFFADRLRKMGTDDTLSLRLIMGENTLIILGEKVI